ncbi:MAG TPA: ATP-binding protein [Candidatus Paceibacterota bacterium]|nr:ATP-binding protein [Candidatus Paceibacterota bacterium]
MQNEKFNQANTPNAGKLMASLRYSGYENKVAISDIVDNSLDADASVVEVLISGDQKAGKATIVVCDNGAGMDEKVLEQALRLGSLTERNVDSDLGRFGMGLVTGSISIAKRVEVYTRTEGSPVLVGIMDLDVMEESNSFDIHRGVATSEQEKIAQGYGLGAHGTVVVLKNCDQLERVEIEEFENGLRHHLGEIYRYFIRAGKKIVVNGKEASIIDPMWLDGRYVEESGYSSDLEFNKTFEIKLGSGVSEQFTVKVFRLPDELPAKGKKKTVGQDTQGFYVLRNYRQVASADDLNGLWVRHNSLNRVRAEILVSGRLDAVMGINYTKHNVNPSQAFLDKIAKEVMPEVDRLRAKYSSRRKTPVASTELDFSEAEGSIAQKTKLLDRAPSIEAANPPSSKRRSPRGVVEVSAYQVGAHQRGAGTLSGTARFENAALGAHGHIFTAEKEGGMTVITWNNEHPFFQKVVFAQRDEQELVNAVSFLAYALGEAKLKYSTAETTALLDAVLETMSKNLKVLLD